VVKDGFFAGQSGSSQEKAGLRSESSTNSEAKPDTEKSPKVVVAEHNRVLKAKVETMTEAGTSL
jgi:hypothetical protein